jgi:hypothetical protein
VNQRLGDAEALRAGYLYVNLELYHDGAAQRLETLWGWWYAAAGHPEIVLRTARGTDAVRVHCDLSPTGREWGFDAFRTIAPLLGDQHAVDRASWLFTPDELQLDGLEMEEAITVARGLVDVATAGRFRPQSVPQPEDPPVRSPRFPQQTCMERSDR